jgi:hypothetical protein
LKDRKPGIAWFGKMQNEKEKNKDKQKDLS